MYRHSLLCRYTLSGCASLINYISFVIEFYRFLITAAKAHVLSAFALETS